jgi:hypothetical protein
LTATIRTAAVVRPWHQWAVALLGAAFHIGGARDHLLVLADDAGCLADHPLALRALGTVGIVAGLLLPCLMLALSRWSVPVAVAGAAAQVVLLAVTFGSRDRWAAPGATTPWLDLGAGVIAVLIAGYCWVMHRRGALRPIMHHRRAAPSPPA